MTYSETRIKKMLIIATSVLALVAVQPATAQVTAKPKLMANNSSTHIDHDAVIRATFTPKAQTKNTRLDYEVLDDALNGTVIRLGPSIRRHMSKPAPRVGTRFIAGHTSPYRLEGSRVSFSFFSEEFLEELVAYRQDLERIGTQIDLTSMAKNEQLAYWFNLHNVAVIEQISKQYPSRVPSDLKVDGKSIDEAKILNIKNVPLSLRDIREKIVYPNWENPLVIYGFFRGDIGSPALQNFAYTSDNVSRILGIQAEEFVNSLRGFNLTSRNRNVSKLYDEAKDFYFKNWDQDVVAHLLQYAREDVAEDIRKDRPIRLDRYDTVIADLVGGSSPRIATAFSRSSADDGVQNLPLEVVQLLRELETKTQVLRQRKLIGNRGRVTIEDVETIDVSVPPPPTVTTTED